MLSFGDRTESSTPEASEEQVPGHDDFLAGAIVDSYLPRAEPSRLPTVRMQDNTEGPTTVGCGEGPTSVGCGDSPTTIGCGDGPTTVGCEDGPTTVGCEDEPPTSKCSPPEGSGS
jgi:hypothetical protein